MKRVVIYTKDVMAYTGKSERASRALLQRIRIRLNKTREPVITVAEFCEHLGVSVDSFPDLQ